MPWQDKEKKLFAVFCNSAASENEFRTAAEKLRMLLIGRAATVAELTNGAPNTAPQLYTGPRVDWGTYKMPWGPHKGEMLADIEVDYLVTIRNWTARLQQREPLNKINAVLLEVLNNFLKSSA